MEYRFDTVIDRRNTDCSKWDRIIEVSGDEGILPLWVADMDFPVAEPITEALQERLKHPIYGYTVIGKGLIDAVCQRLQRLYDWTVEPEWLVFTPGVMPAVNTALKAFTNPGDKVVIESPVYPPFFSAAKNSRCEASVSELVMKNGRFEIDFDDLEARLADPRSRVLLLSSPHNPGGRMWSREELERMAESACRHGCYIVSDEIHCELLLHGRKHIPIATLSEEAARRSVVCMAPSKTFNLAGLSASVTIIPDEEVRKTFNQARAGMVGSPNLFGRIAMEAAYRHGDEWLKQVLEYIEGNLAYLTAFFTERIPTIKVMQPEATYLVWLDCRDLGMSPEELSEFFRKTARVWLNDGYTFGPGGEGFMRINIACPRTTLEKALVRIEQAVTSLS